jgi:hypothetical protein
VTRADNGSTPKQRGDYSHIWKHIEFSEPIRTTDSYIVYLDKKGELDWQTTVEYDQKDTGDQTKHNAILSDEAVLECTPCHGLPDQTRRHFRRLLGEALACNLEYDYSNAAQMLREAAAYIKARSEEMSRRWYLSASTTMTAAMLILGGMVWANREKLSASLTTDAIWLFIAAVAGSCGALLSVIWRSGNLKVDCNAGRMLHYLEGASRIWAGALSGVIIALAVKSELILTALTHGANGTNVAMLAAFVGGTGERLATSIISKFESTHLGPTNREPQHG